MSFRFKNFSLNSLILAALLSLLPVHSVHAVPDCPTEYARIGRSGAPITEQALGLRRISAAVDWGPVVRIKAGPNTRQLSQIETLAIMQYNMLNVFMYRGRFERVSGGGFQRLTDAFEKPAHQVISGAETIKREKIDIGCFEELESMQALDTYTRDFLNDEFHRVLIEGNDDRGIDIGFVIRKDLPLDVEVQSFKNVRAEASDSALFSRDLPVAQFRPAGAPEDSRPLFILIGTHFKSQRSGPNDPNGLNTRSEQVRAAVKIIQYYQARYGRDLPILMAGDFNADVRYAREFEPLWREARMTDGFKLLPPEKFVLEADRVTHSYHPRGAATSYSQLDSISGSEIVRERQIVESVRVVHYVDANGNPKPMPRTYEEREENGSDHRPLKMLLKVRPMIDGYNAHSAETGFSIPASGSGN